MGTISQFGTGDLAGVVIQRDHEFAGYAEAVIRSWNSDTFEHTINVRGSDLHNLDVCSGIEALTYQPGDMVILTRWKPRSRRGSATYRIGGGGRIIRPGTGAAEAAISALRSNIAKQLSAEIFGERVHGGRVSASETTTSTSYTDLATVGPSVSAVNVSPAGKLMVWLASSVAGGSASDSVGNPSMSLEVDGPTSFTPGSLFPIVNSITVASPTGAEIAVSASLSTMYVLDVDPGDYTLTAKYRSTDGDEVRFTSRSLVVIGS